jgi:asparagine synthase (glutamine-hydrolysing)
LRTDGGPAEATIAQAMTDRLRTRGPDGEGIHVSGNVVLGHRRLAIIDLTGGYQPLANEDGTVWV